MTQETVMLSVANKLYELSDIVLSDIMLSDIMLNVVILNVVAPFVIDNICRFVKIL